MELKADTTQQQETRTTDVRESVNKECFTYKKNRYRRYLIHDIEKEHPEEVVNERQQRLGNNIVKAHRLNRTNAHVTKTKMAPFLLITEPNTTIKEGRDLRAIVYIRFRAEEFKNSATIVRCLDTHRLTATGTVAALGVEITIHRISPARLLMHHLRASTATEPQRTKACTTKEVNKVKFTEDFAYEI